MVYDFEQFVAILISKQSNSCRHLTTGRHVIHTTFIVLYAFAMRQATPKLK